MVNHGNQRILDRNGAFGSRLVKHGDEMRDGRDEGGYEDRCQKDREREYQGSSRSPP